MQLYCEDGTIMEMLLKNDSLFTFCIFVHFIFKLVLCFNMLHWVWTVQLYLKPHGKCLAHDFHLRWQQHFAVVLYSGLLKSLRFFIQRGLHPSESVAHQHVCCCNLTSVKARTTIEMSNKLNSAQLNSITHLILTKKMSIFQSHNLHAVIDFVIA